MTLPEKLLAEFDHEMAVTRKYLERIPEGALSWRPHEKSMTLGQLATHLAMLPRMAVVVLTTDSFDLAARGQSPVLDAPAAMLEAFDTHVATVRAAFANTTDDALTTSWTLLAGGKTIFSLPRITALRNMVTHHLIHHRAQLGLYLRMNDVPLPATYGPSADERGR